jgi:hypothetical protein
MRQGGVDEEITALSLTTEEHLAQVEEDLLVEANPSHPRGMYLKMSAETIGTMARATAAFNANSSTSNANQSVVQADRRPHHLHRDWTL